MKQVGQFNANYTRSKCINFHYVWNTLVIAQFRALVFNPVTQPQKGREPFLEGSRIDILRMQLYYICFIRVLDGGRWVVVVGCYNGSRC